MAAAATAGKRERLYRPLPLCLSVAAHLAALLLLAQHMGSHGASASTQKQAPRVLQVSLAQPLPPPAAASPMPPPRLQQRQVPTVAPVPAARAVRTLRTISHRPPVPVAAPAAVPESMPDAPQPSRLAETAAGSLPEPRYYLLRELSVRPAVLEDATPGLAFEGVPAQTVILRLFINEDGGIDRVAAEQSVLPEAHAQRLIEAFARARFLPGQLDGKPVKSQMRIEVRLESALQRDVSLQ
ncbi:energy transducer TonB [Noviherbaspirillum malthae]|uniref:energy transducer TonB n=1 Tax=Noviherbaspirillum malthae TaxID=1260987 RepID=UPI00188DD041|nr:hypothetical protein [Noviherbaspirillum malthae]